MCGRTTWSAVLIGWVALAGLGHHLTIRAYLMALGAVMVATTYAALRGSEWVAALRLGRRLERDTRPAADLADTVDLSRYREERRSGRDVAS